MSSYSQQHDGYYPPWLTDQKIGDEYKRSLVIKYEDFFKEENKQLKAEKLKEVRAYLTVVCDVIAYRYLVKYYSNLFHKLNITVEEYMDYKVERMYVTIKDKKEPISDILSYIYMSFMLSSPRLIYDYGEKIGRCKLVKDILPYFRIQRLKFFFIEKENVTEHYVYNVDNIELDSESNSELIRSNMDKSSLQRYNTEQSILNSASSFDVVKEFIINNISFSFDKSKKYLLSIFDNWATEVEFDFQYIKQISELKDNSFNLVDYIRYKYENKQTDLSYDEYLDVLHALNLVLKKGYKG